MFSVSTLVPKVSEALWERALRAKLRFDGGRVGRVTAIVVVSRMVAGVSLATAFTLAVPPEWVTLAALSDFAPDHYATLGLDRRCTAAQIRSAFRLLSKQHHPDLHGGAEEAVRRAQELNAAHEILSDPALRRAYDRDLADGERGAAAPRRAGKIERDVRQDALLRIEDFLRGTELDVRVQDPANPHGAESYRLEVPAGTAPGTRFRLERAEPFAGGWVVVRVKVRPGARFKARGADLRCELRIDARRATQGGTEAMPGPAGGMLRVAIPAGVGRGEIVRIAGEGLPKPRGGRGDLLVRVTYRPEVRVTPARGR